MQVEGPFEPLDPRLVDWGTARKSSSSLNGDCVELATGPGVVGFQDSKEAGNPDRTRLVVSREAAARFLADAKKGLYDL